MGARKDGRPSLETEAAPEDIFCCDSDSIIDLDSAGLMNSLRKLVRTGRVKIPKGVNRELQRKTDAVAKKLRQWDAKYGLVVDLDQDLHALEHFSRISVTYGPPFKVGTRSYRGFWKSASGGRAADAEVVALAKSKNWIVISNDEAIHGACMVEGVICRRWEEIGRLIYRQGVLPLFAGQP